jgi:hypothetical protein
VVIEEAEKILTAEYGGATAAGEGSKGPEGAAGEGAAPAHPLHLLVSMAKAEVYSAKSQHVLAVTEMGAAAAGLEALLASSQGAGKQAPAAWVTPACLLACLLARLRSPAFG